MVNMMASEITGSQAASPVKIQQRFNPDRVASQPDMSSTKPGMESLDSVLSNEGLKRVKDELAEEKKLASVPTEKTAKEEAENEDKLTEKIAQLNDYSQKINREIQFSVDEGTDRTVVKVIDSETDKVIRQIPSEEVLKIAESLENFSGMLLQEQA
jgi:flagellar protein FlaG